jgi:hypothetical protein
MKNLYLALVSMFICVNSFAQDAIYYKAVYLREFYNTTTKQIAIDDNARTALKDIYDEADVDKLVAALNVNPFINSQLFVKKAAGSSGAFNFGSSLGGIDVSNIAKGLSLFLIERAKQELNIAFFNRFRKFSEKNPEFKILFPDTYSALDKLLDYSYPQMLPTLQKAFIKDLETVITRIDDVLEEPRYKALLEKLPEVSICIRSIRLVQELETGYSNPAEVIKSFAAFPEWKFESTSVALKNTGSTLAVINLLSESLRKKTAADSKEVWISLTELKRLMDDEILFKIYAALLYKKIDHDNIKFYDKSNNAKPFAPEFAKHTAEISTLHDKIKDFYMLTNEVGKASKVIKDKIDSKTEISNEEYYAYINSALNILDNSIQTINKYTQTPITGNYLVIVRKSNEIYKNVYTKNYAQVFNGAIDVFDLVLKQVEERQQYPSLKANSNITGYGGKEKERVREMATMDGSFSEIETAKIDVILGDKPNLKDEVKQAVAHYRLAQLVHFLKGLKPYGLFMANMVDAKDPEEVKVALENAVLPVGSSSVKKNSKSNIVVQAYLGAYLANKDRSYSSWTSKFGVIAPVGISYTPGFLSWKQVGSVSIFGSLIDVGAIVDYDLKQEPTVPGDGTNATNAVSKDYKIKLGQIFSPGVFLVYGFFDNIPLSLGFGTQYGPGLSKVTTDDSTPVINNPSWRWSAFLSVDIPLFNLKNKIRNK